MWWSLLILKTLSVCGSESVVLPGHIHVHTEECGHMRPTSSYGLSDRPQYVLGSFTPLLRAIHL